MLIAERFVSPIESLQRLDLPDDVTTVAPGRALDAVVMDEFGVHCRRARIGPPPPGMAGNRIGFEPIPVPERTRLWLFVVAADLAGGAVTPDLVESLLRHGRALGGRPPITLIWNDLAENADAVTDPPVGDESQDRIPPAITFAMLSEEPDPTLLPPLDQADINIAGLTPEQRAWRQDGVAILRQFFPDALLDPYIGRRAAFDRPSGWWSPAPYLQVEELRVLCLYPPLRRILRALVGEEMMLHLNLTGWVSTERNWHQDDYLNPPFVNGWYAAVWIALDHIHPDSGPFEYIPGSHRWPLLRGDKVRGHMTEEERSSTIGLLAVNNWPKISERFVVPAIEAEIRDRGATPQRFLARKGDALIWHGRLLHRGTVPAQPDLERRAVIAHYSGVNHRQDMAERKVDAQGGTWAVFDMRLF
ncbi:MAG TPA: phytanoyl-CoA dioxygenase family protein [Acetobacteraceae bacterium]|nr:phytanoyl-CoA dioxygenase family protein [Acetobacteraceae bacterium]